VEVRFFGEFEAVEGGVPVPGLEEQQNGQWR